MKLTSIAKTVLEKRYLKKVDGKVVEGPDDLIRRVAHTLAAIDGEVYGKSKKDVKALEDAFHGMLDRQDFMPNSPTLMNAGRELGQLSACFVLPVEDSMENIFDTIKHAALIHQSGGGTGFSFSRLRPKNDVVRSTGGVASGPVSFMKVFNAATEAVKQGGTRRGANMGIVRVDHPDILEFVACKNDLTQVTNFNISVTVTDKFMQALEVDGEYELINPRNGAVAGKLRARDVFDKIVDGAWATGEPGLIFIDRVNDNNPSINVEPIESTNPCGEQPLGPFESCNLGSINVANFVLDPHTDKAEVDWKRLAKAIHLATHFLDNVIDANKFPLPQIEAKTRANRRIGLGVMGWAEMLVQLNLAYDSDEAVEFAKKLMRFLHDESIVESERLAGERGAYPNWKGSRWDAESPYAKAPWAGHKVRNATLTTVAPTGTISIIAARPDMPCSGGIEPKFALAFTRNQAGALMVDVDGQFEEIAKAEGWYSPELMAKIAEHGSVRGVAGVPEKWQRVFATSHDISPEWHVKMQAAWQVSGVDSAVSKTINFSHHATKEQVEEAYWLAYRLGCKGITVYRDGSRFGQVLSVGTTTAEKKDETPAPVVAAVPAAAPVGPSVAPRPNEAMGKMFVIPTHFGKMTLDVHMHDNGDPFEVIVNVGAVGSDLMADAVALGMLISKMLRLRSDVSVGERVQIVIDDLKNIGGAGSYGFGPNKVTSLASAIARGLQRFLAWREGRSFDEAFTAPVLSLPLAAGGQEEAATLEVDVHVDPCPECGSHALVMGEGCHTCKNCGYSKCS